jgi:glutamyl-tRNA reductase
MTKRVLRVGKRARTETAIGRFTTSVSHAAIKLAQERLGDLTKSHIVIVGAGEMASHAGHALRERGATNMTVINRTYARSTELAAAIGAQPLNWFHLAEELSKADLVVTTTDAPHTVIFAKEVEEILPKREGRPLWFLDIALPRDVDPAIDEFENVTVNDIDDLKIVVDKGREQREAAIPEIEAIISEEMKSYYEWLQSRDVVPVIVDLRQRLQTLIEKEAAEAASRVASPEDRELINRLAHRVLNKILHEPSTRLKASTLNGNGVAYADAIRTLFALDEVDDK